MIKAVIIDDEAGNIELVTNLLKLCGMPVQVIATAYSVESGHQTLLNNPPDLVFLDVEMKDGTGFDLLKRFEAIDFKVIFITAHQEFAITAFKFSALDYLLKPVSPLDFVTAVKKAEQAIGGEEMNVKLQTLLYNINDQSRTRKKVVLKTLDRIYAIYASDIIRFESDGSYTTVYLSDGKKIMVSRLLKEFDDMLAPSGFVRSHLVNIEQVFCFERSESQIIMKDESIVPVSARKKELIMSLIQS
jgi:two-component system LytT family response regulator